MSIAILCIRSQALTRTRPEERTPSRAPPSTDALGDAAGTRIDGQPASESATGKPICVPSQSTQNLLQHQGPASPSLRRVQTTIGLNAAIPRTPSVSTADVVPLPLPALVTLEAASVEAPALGDQSLRVTETQQTNSENTTPLGPHLHTMDISQQLRSMSQLSDTAELESVSTCRPSFHNHRREQSDIGRLSCQSRHSRQYSALGTHLVHSRVASLASSSLYSRPSGRDTSLSQAATDPKHAPFTAQLPSSLDAACLDWPLHMPASHDGAFADAAIPKFDVDGMGSHSRGTLPSSSPYNIIPSGSSSYVTALNRDNTSVKWLSPPQRSTSIPSRGSSSNLTIQSKSSRFFERLSPPKKLVKKRRSLFKFLRPGSRKHEGRSISTPTLSAVSQGHTDTYDGAADDAGLLTIQYELEEQPATRVRSASMNQLGGQRRNTAAQLDVPNARAASVYQMEGLRRSTAAQLDVPDIESIRRRPSLADYERNLTIIGDDRRRPSTIDLVKLQELQDEDRKQSIHLLPTLSRAKRLDNEPPTGLMAQALAKHQNEKALFRSASKQKESLGHAGHIQAAFGLGNFNTPLPDSGAIAHVQNTNPGIASASHDRTSASEPGRYIGVAHTASAATLQTPAFLQTPPAASRRASSAAPTTSSFRAQNTNKIGTSLSSWSRYPSHTRTDRCSSAGRADAVLSRDFAIDIDPEHITSDDGETDVMEGRPKKHGSKRGKGALRRRSSTMFSGLLRYYSNIFSAGSGPQNRRSSVMTGGWLANPDLEMLPPSNTAETAAPHHDHYFKYHLHRLEEQMLHEVEHLEEEADKLMHLDLAHHRSSSHADSTPFRQDSLFHNIAVHTPSRKESVFVGPMDDMGEDSMLSQALQDTDAEALSSSTAKRSNGRLDQFDGARDEADIRTGRKVSKADLWSAVYQECLTLPPSTEAKNRTAPASVFPDHYNDSHSMPPPMLRPTKARSPVQPKALDAKSSIRRFPSVTVVDDRKGHSRSVSLISVKVDGSGVSRGSTYDLLQLIEEREKVEREKLLGLDTSVSR